MNVVEAYIKFNGQLVILISGMSGSGKSSLAKEIARDFKITHINGNKYCNPKYDVKVKLPNGDDIINWDSDDIYDWKTMNEDIKASAAKGVVVSNVSFPKDKMQIESNFHLHIKLGKQNLFKRRTEYLDDHKEDCQTSGRNLDKELELLILNKYTLPYYFELVPKMVITKYINANEMMNDIDKYHDKLYDEAFDYLINQIQKYLDEKNGIKQKTDNVSRYRMQSRNIDHEEPSSDSSDGEGDDLDTTSDNLSDNGYML